MDYSKATQSINDVNFLKREENIFKMIELIQAIANQSQNPRKEQTNFLQQYLRVMTIQKDMKKQIFIESLIECLKTLQVVVNKGVQIDLKIIMMKIITFAGQNSFTEYGLHLSKYFFFYQINPNVNYQEFSKSNKGIQWNLSNIEIEAIKNIKDTKEREKNNYILLSRVKLLQKAVGKLKCYFEEAKANLSLVGRMLTEQDNNYKEYIFLNHKLIVCILQNNEKTEISQISNFYLHHFNSGYITQDQLGQMLIEILRISRSNSFEKYLIHSIIVDSVAQLASQSTKSGNGYIFENKEILNLIEILCYQLEDIQLIQKITHYLWESPSPQKIKHICLLIKISSALKEDMATIEFAESEKIKRQLPSKLSLDMKDRINQDSTTLYLIQNMQCQTSNNNSKTSSSTITLNNQKSKNKSFKKNLSSRKRFQNSPSDSVRELKENIDDQLTMDQFDEKQNQKEQVQSTKMIDETNQLSTQQQQQQQQQQRQQQQQQQQQFQYTFQSNFSIQQQFLKKIKEEDQYYRLCEEYQKIKVNQFGKMEIEMAIKIFNQIQHFKEIYFNHKLNSKSILKDLELIKNKTSFETSDKRKIISDQEMDQDLLYLLIIQNLICQLISEEKVNRYELRSQNLFYIFKFFLSMIQDQDNIDFTYKQSYKNSVIDYTVFSVQFKQLVSDILKSYKQQNLLKKNSKSSKGRSLPISPELKQQMEDERVFYISYFIRVSICLFRNNIGQDISYDLIETIMENLECDDIDLIHTIINTFCQEENVNLDKKLRVIADRAIELLLEFHALQNDSQRIIEIERITSSVQKEARAASNLQQLAKIFQVTSLISLIYLNTKSNNHSSYIQSSTTTITHSILIKMEELKELYLKNQPEAQQLFASIVMETVFKFLFCKKQKSYANCLNILGIFNEVGNSFIKLLKLNEKDTIEQLKQLVTYMEFCDLCITQIITGKFGVMFEEEDEKENIIKIIRNLSISNFNHFYSVESLNVVDEKAFNKVLIQILTKLTQILNKKIIISSTNQTCQNNFKAINLKLSLVNKIIYLILENRMEETSSSTQEVINIQKLYEGGTHYNQIFLMLSELNEDIFQLISQSVIKAEHTYNYLINYLLVSDTFKNAPIFSKFEQIQEALSWQEIKQLLHSFKQMKEQANYFKVYSLSSNLILIEILFLRFIQKEGYNLRKITHGLHNSSPTNSHGLLLEDERIVVCDEDEIKEEYFEKFVQLRIEDSVEEYIKILYKNKIYEEARKIQIYMTANSQIDNLKVWLQEIKKSLNKKGIKQVKALVKYRVQIKCLIYEISVQRVENNCLSTMFGYQREQSSKIKLNDMSKQIHLRDIMKLVDKIENKIERYQRASSQTSSIKQSQTLNYLILSFRMHLYCSQYIRKSNQSHLSTQLIEKTFRRLTSYCFEKAVGNLNDIYFQNTLRSGESYKFHAAAKASSELTSQSLIGSVIDPFAKIFNTLNNRKFSGVGRVTGDLIDYLNIANGFQYFKASGTRQFQLLLIQSLKDYCKIQMASNCFTNLKYYGNLLKTASFRFLMLNELLMIESLIKEHTNNENNNVFIDVIGNILQSKQMAAPSLHTLFNRRKSSVVTMQLSTFIQSLEKKLLTQNIFFQSSHFYKASMKYLISNFTTTIRTNHKNLESEICEMISFTKKKYQCIIQTSAPQIGQNQSNILQKNQKGQNINGIQNRQSSNLCEVLLSVLTLEPEQRNQSDFLLQYQQQTNVSNNIVPYMILSQDFSEHIICHKNRSSFALRYLTLLQSLNLLSKVTACRVNLATQSSGEINNNEEIYGLFIKLINFREICKLLHNSFLQFHITYAKQQFYLYHKFDETIKELLREMPSLLHIYKNNTIVQSCSCVNLSNAKVPLLSNGEESFFNESFSLDTSYMYKSVLAQHQGTTQSSEENKETLSPLKKQIQTRQSQQPSNQSLNNSSMKEKNMNFNSYSCKDEQILSSPQNQKQRISYTGFFVPRDLTNGDFQFKKLRTSMKDFSIQKYNNCSLNQDLEKSFKNSKINKFDFRKHQFSQLGLEHDIIILNFIEYNNERAIQISKFNHLTRQFTSFRINNQSQTNLFSDYMNDIKKIYSNNQSEMKDEEKKRRSQINSNTWWKSRDSNDKQILNILNQMSQVLDYHLFVIYGSENKEREMRIFNKVSELVNISEEFSLTDSQSSNTSEFSSTSSESQILDQEKKNLLELLFSFIKCSLFLNINKIKQKLIFELICIQNIYLQYLGIQSQQYLFAEMLKLQEEEQKNYIPYQKKPIIWMLSENIQTVPLEFMSCFPDHNQCFYRIPSIQYLIENYKVENKINFASNYYVLNPSGDLKNTQSRFQSKFEQIRSWEGVSGFSVSSNELQKVLESYQTYTYIGHGAGELYLNQKQIQDIRNIKAAVLLFGCQSARQVVQYDSNSTLYEITGNSLYYLINKCKLLVGSLWDITDRDTDKMIFQLIQMFQKATIHDSIDFSYALLQAREKCRLKQLNGSCFISFGIPSQFYME